MSKKASLKIKMKFEGSNADEMMDKQMQRMMGKKGKRMNKSKVRSAAYKLMGGKY